MAVSGWAGRGGSGRLAVACADDAPMHRLRMIICIYGGMCDAHACAQAREAELKRLRRQRSRASGGGGGGGGGAVKRKKKTRQDADEGEAEFDDGGGGGGGIPVAYADPSAAMLRAVTEAAKTMAVAGGGEAELLYECRVCGCGCECECESE